VFSGGECLNRQQVELVLASQLGDHGAKGSEAEQTDVVGQRHKCSDRSDARRFGKCGDRTGELSADRVGSEYGLAEPRVPKACGVDIAFDRSFAS